MTAPPVPPIVPGLTTPGMPRTPQQHAALATRQRSPLPLTKLSAVRTKTAAYDVCAIDARGRVGGRTTMKALGWEPGQRLDMVQSGDLIVAAADDGGLLQVSEQGYLRLAIACRRWCRLESGDRVLLAGYPGEGLLVIHPFAVLDEVIAEVHRRLLGGEQE